MKRAGAIVMALVALAGFFASMAVHSGTFFDQPAIPDPRFWILHVGSIVVMLPVIAVARALTRDRPGADYWKATLRGCPGWMRMAFWTLALYAAVNFLLYIAALEGLSLVDGAQNDRRGFSGHWMIFYFAAFATMYSYLSVRSTDD